MSESFNEAQQEYRKALKAGLRQLRELSFSGKDPHPAVLDHVLQGIPQETVQDVGVIEIPCERVVGVVSAGRTPAFSAGFLPILRQNTEFADKWITLCAAHLSETGIRDPIECTEYLGNFYIQEGNKRFSVLNYFGAARIQARVRRIMPLYTPEPEILTYYEFLVFYRDAKTYAVHYRFPGQYAQLVSCLGKQLGDEWEEWERRRFAAYFQYFRDAYSLVKNLPKDVRPEEALLLWLQIHGFQDLGQMSTDQLRKSIVGLRQDLSTLKEPGQVQVETSQNQEKKSGILNRLMPSIPDTLNLAFVHSAPPEDSPWTMAHEEGRRYVEAIYGSRIQVKTYCMGRDGTNPQQLLQQAVEEGARVIFTTSPQMSRYLLKAAAEYPKVRFYNCAPDAAFPSVRCYSCRSFEGKFILGAVCGAVSQDQQIGYVATAPVFGETAAINAFALGVQMTNPKAEVVLDWTCLPGDAVDRLISRGIRLISGPDIPAPDPRYLSEGRFGAFFIGDDGTRNPIGSVCNLWGVFYTTIVKALLEGNWGLNSVSPKPVSYWWGMDSGVVDVLLDKQLPAGVQHLGQILRDICSSGNLDPFDRTVTDQSGQVVCTGGNGLKPADLLRIYWLCSNIRGKIPEFQELAPFAQSRVRQLGIYREQIPKEKEGFI